MNIERHRPPFGHTEPLNNPEALGRALAVLGDPRFAELNRGYPPWHKVLHRARAIGLDPEDAWRALLVSRLAWRRPLTGISHGLSLAMTPGQFESLRAVDLACGGGGPFDTEDARGVLADPHARDRFAIRSMMDEAIESSIIEGAATTRAVAIEMLRSAREPRTHGERMIANNYAALRLIRSWGASDLTTDRLLELHRVVTAGTLDRPSEAGRLRLPSDPVAVVDVRDNEVLHTPPAADGIADRIDRLCEFANRSHRGDEYLHPVVKACVLHFVIGFEHPFTDGNGRTARAVFLWSVLRSGYKVFEYLVVSELIRRSPARYMRAYVDAETDGGDVTYFVVYMLRVIGLALERLGVYLEEERERINRSLRLAASARGINLRQRILLDHALRRPRAVFTARSHSNSTNVTLPTARSDLAALVRRRYLVTYRSGREVQYVPAPDLPARLAGRPVKGPGRRR